MSRARKGLDRSKVERFDYLMGANTITMEPHDPIITGTAAGVVEKAAEYWGIAVAFITGLGGIFLFYRRFLKGRYHKFKAWVMAVVNAPLAIAALKEELEYETGVTIRQKLDGIGADLVRIGHILSNEIANRRAALQAVETPLFEFDINGKFVWANDSLLEITESEMSDVLGNNWKNTISDPDRQDVLIGWARAVKEGSDFKSKFRLNVDGGTSWVAFSVVCNKDSVGNVLGWIGKLRPCADPRRVQSDNEGVPE